MDNATLAKLGRALYPWKTVVQAQSAEIMAQGREIRRLEWERDRLRAERDDAEKMLDKWVQRAIERAKGEI